MPIGYSSEIAMPYFATGFAFHGSRHNTISKFVKCYHGDGLGEGDGLGLGLGDGDGDGDGLGVGVGDGDGDGDGDGIGGGALAPM
jgi:hypothetical protein